MREKEGYDRNTRQTTRRGRGSCGRALPTKGGYEAGMWHVATDRARTLTSKGLCGTDEETDEKSERKTSHGDDNLFVLYWYNSERREQQEDEVLTLTRLVGVVGG